MAVKELVSGKKCDERGVVVTELALDSQAGQSGADTARLKGAWHALLPYIDLSAFEGLQRMVLKSCSVVHM